MTTGFWHDDPDGLLARAARALDDITPPPDADRREAAIAAADKFQDPTAPDQAARRPLQDLVADVSVG